MNTITQESLELMKELSQSRIIDWLNRFRQRPACWPLTCRQPPKTFIHSSLPSGISFRGLAAALVPRLIGAK